MGCEDIGLAVTAGRRNDDFELRHEMRSFAETSHGSIYVFAFAVPRGNGRDPLARVRLELFVADGAPIKRFPTSSRLHQLYGSESIEEILAGIIDRKRRLNRLVELQSKTMVTAPPNV
jgi:hypothetical protein